MWWEINGGGGGSGFFLLCFFMYCKRGNSNSINDAFLVSVPLFNDAVV